MELQVFNPKYVVELTKARIEGAREHPLANSVPVEYAEEYDQAQPLTKRPARITRDLIPHGLVYKVVQKSPLSRQISKTCHNGQRKLALTEIQFLTELMLKLGGDMHRRAFVIYAGSAPSMKIFLLSAMFPGVIFVMIDPNEHLFRIGDDRKNHYGHPDHNLVRYMSVSATNSFYDSHSKTKTVNHWIEGRVNKLTIPEDIPAGLTLADGKPNPKIAEYILRESSQDAPEHGAKFFVFEEYMTEQVAEALQPLMADGAPVCLWSDIRAKHSVPEDAVQDARRVQNLPGSIDFDKNKKKGSIRATGTDDEEYPDDIDVISGAAMFYIWAKALAKGHEDKLTGMFKFRVPYCNDPVDWSHYTETIERAKELGADYREAVERDKALLMFAGKIYLQAWAGITSAESRLWFEGVRDLIGHPISEQEEKLFYYNIIERFACMFDNPYADREIGFDHCGDCAIEAHILARYQKLNPKADITTMVESLSSYTRRALLAPGGYHGKAF